MSKIKLNLSSRAVEGCEVTFQKALPLFLDFNLGTPIATVEVGIEQGQLMLDIDETLIMPNVNIGTAGTVLEMNDQGQITKFKLTSVSLISPICGQYSDSIYNLFKTPLKSNRMTYLEKIEERKRQIKQWKDENRLGFDLWRTEVTYRISAKETISLSLTCCQCKDGIYILQVNQVDFSFLIYKAGADISQK